MLGSLHIMKLQTPILTSTLTQVPDHCYPCVWERGVQSLRLQVFWHISAQGSASPLLFHSCACRTRPCSWITFPVFTWVGALLILTVHQKGQSKTHAFCSCLQFLHLSCFVPIWEQPLGLCSNQPSSILSPAGDMCDRLSSGNVRLAGWLPWLKSINAHTEELP